MVNINHRVARHARFLGSETMFAGFVDIQLMIIDHNDRHRIAMIPDIVKLWCGDVIELPCTDVLRNQTALHDG